MVYVVAYDLTTPNNTPADYERVISAIKSLYPTWARIEQSVFLVDSNAQASAVRDSLLQFLYQYDRLFVGRLSTWAGYNLEQDRATWLQNRRY